MPDIPIRDSNVVDELLADGSMVLFHTTSRQLVTLNAAGAFVWEHCDGTCSVADIEHQLRSLYPETPSLAADVAAIIKDLRERGMIPPDRRQVR